jgi:hypothetical protein
LQPFHDFRPALQQCPAALLPAIVATATATNSKEKAMLKQTISLRKAAMAAIVAALISLPAMSVAQAKYRTADQPSMAKQCEIVGSISHRCLNFDSDSMWPEGLADFHGTNGG